MIAEHNNYLCGSSDAPSEAIMICQQQGCTSFALTCGKKNCDCRLTHKGHNMVYLDDILEKVAQPIKLPEQLSKLESSVDIVIDGFIRQMEQLRIDHRQHIRQTMEQHMDRDALRTKLSRKEELERGEATGDMFFRMIQDLDKPLEIDSPYRLEKEAMEKELLAIHDGIDALGRRLEQLWRPIPPNVLKPLQFRFSSDHKHKGITLLE